MPPIFSHLSTAQNLQNILAAANEEGVVRIYNTGQHKSSENPLLKGACKACFFF